MAWEAPANLAAKRLRHFELIIRRIHPAEDTDLAVDDRCSVEAELDFHARQLYPRAQLRMNASAIAVVSPRYRPHHAPIA